MNFILISFSLTLLVVVVGVILTYNGYFKDSDKDGIPDKVEDKVKEVKKIHSNVSLARLDKWFYKPYKKEGVELKLVKTISNVIAN